MSDKDLIRIAFDRYHTCVVIPTYNNAATLATVIAGVLEYTGHIIVVNDGSTDNTGEVLSFFPQVEQVSYSPNRGKGIALRRGFEKALDSGYAYAITIDSDGQHFADDLPVFMRRLQETGDALIIGARNMKQAGIPGKSSFGNRFSNFWFKVETGINAPDTQSGFRLYPIALIKGMRFFTRKYEFEIEALVRCAWKGIKIESVPISVYYAPGEERVSHFRPFTDFFRISILNTLLVFVAFFYVKPKKFFRALFVWENWTRFFKERVINVDEPAHIKAFSVALGICMGILPIWGFQLVSAIFLSVILKLNKALVIIAANISLPPMIPLIIYLSYKTGGIWMKGGEEGLTFSDSLSLESVKNNFEQYVYGAVTLSFIAGVVGGLITWILVVCCRKKTSSAV